MSKNFLLVTYLYNNKVFEYFGDCSLKEFIDNEEYNKEDVSLIFKQLVSAMLSLHQAELFHRDIKPGNIIIEKSSKKIKLIDFGMTDYYSKNKEYSPRVGTLPFKAPELLLEFKHYNSSVDIWSAGIVLACLVV